MRKLYLGNGYEQFKFADTTTEIHLNAFDDGSAASLTTNAKVRIKNDAGYLLGISASITDNHAVITSGQLAQLPVGSYLLELWDTVDGGTAIYPSDGFLALQINENATGISGGLVSSITVDDFIKQFGSLSEQLKQQVADAIANGLKGDKGDKGDTGPQGDTGPTGIQGPKGDTGAAGAQGIQGPVGKGFSIAKIYPSVAEMTAAKGAGLTTGDFVIIASTVSSPDNATLYTWNGTTYVEIADLSGAQGIQGPQGIQGVKGDMGATGPTGPQGIQGPAGPQGIQGPAGPQGDKGDKGDDAVINVVTQANYDALADKSGVYFIEEG